MSFLKSKKKYAVLAVILIGGGVFLGYKAFAAKPASETIVYKEEMAQKGTIKVEYTVDGVVELPFRYMDFENQGEIQAIFFKEGDTFKKGEPVAKQSDLDTKQELEKAKLALEKAEINYRDTQLKQQSGMQDVETKKLSYEQQINKQEKSIYDLEQNIHSREKEIENMELTPEEYALTDIETVKNELESLKRSLIVEKQALDLLKRELELLKPDVDSSVKLSSINIEEAKISYENAKVKVEQTNMYAREHGKILTITKAEGEAVAAISSGQGSADKSFITYIATSEPYVVTMSIPEFDLSSIKIGQKTEVLIEGFSEQSLLGKVTKISDIPVIDSNQVVTYEATVQLDEKPEGLKNGMNAVVSIISKEVKDVVTVPNDTVFYENGRQYVQVKDNDGNITNIDIVTGFSDGTTAEVKKGLTGNERLVSKAQVSVK